MVKIGIDIRDRIFVEKIKSYKQTLVLPTSMKIADCIIMPNIWYSVFHSVMGAFCNLTMVKTWNPESGWEKENVENKVGYLRRNELVPVPRFDSLAEENRYLLDRCETDMQREHYDDNSRFISELFEEDKTRLLRMVCKP